MHASYSPSFLSISSTPSNGSVTTTMYTADSVRCRHVSVSDSCATTAERPTPAFTSRHIASSRSLYEVLGIRKGATCQEIKSAYRRLARVLHPDVASSDDRMGREFMMVHEAYVTLSDPGKRADYDGAMMGIGPRPSSARAGLRTRRWETDQCW